MWVCVFRTLSIRLFGYRLASGHPSVLLLLVFSASVSAQLIVFNLISGDCHPLMVTSKGAIRKGLMDVISPLIERPLQEFNVLIGP